MIRHTEAEAYIDALSGETKKLVKAVHKVFVKLQCTSYAKTVYVGYETDGGMVAALYAQTGNIEVALALPVDAADDVLVDASHLKWRTLPVAAVIDSAADVKRFELLAREAVERIRSNRHDVNREAEYFRMGRRRRRDRD